MRDVMKSIDTIRQEADKRMRAQQSRQSGQQCGPVELKKEVSFKAQAALSTQHQLPNRAANRKAKWRFLPTGVVMRMRNALKFLDSIGQRGRQAPESATVRRTVWAGGVDEGRGFFQGPGESNQC
ncbi:hypothetical protein AAFF_G00410740 [Aldrovandia affinis]|uniref:Uncharacterized protein n=1 Tax=Aldrovandia affinis TaxID=143900 RepID=A0AAD7R3Q0_9TELE|nr:hypothetical protein AAFF_G00410740 [Aldrovandia affinis]